MRISFLGSVLVFVMGLANADAAMPPGNFSTGSHEANPAYATLASWFNEGSGETSAQVDEPSLLEDPYAKDSADYGKGSCGKGGCGSLWGSLCNCSGYDPCCRRLIVSVGAIFLTRDMNADTVFVTDEWGDPQLTADDYDSLGTQAGPYADVIWQGECWGLQARYFEVDGWTANAGPVHVPASGASYEFFTPVTYFWGATDITSTYTSELHSFELNLRRRFTCTCSGFIGFRALELDEQLNFYGMVADPIPTHASLATRNRLYGAQIGLDGTLFRINRFSVEGWGRAGIYANNREARSFFGGYPPGDPDSNYVISRTIGDSDAAFVGDLGLFGVYQITPCLAIRAGYTALWLDGVSTAVGQFPNTTPDPDCTSGGRMSDDTVFAHGAMVALEYYWGAGGSGGKGGFVK